GRGTDDARTKLPFGVQGFSGRSGLDSPASPAWRRHDSKPDRSRRHRFAPILSSARTDPLNDGSIRSRWTCWPSAIKAETFVSAFLGFGFQPHQAGLCLPAMMPITTVFPSA